MADIISFERAKGKKEELEANDLNSLIKRASLICKKRADSSRDESGIIREAHLKNFFEGKIVQEIFSRRLISSQLISNYLPNTDRKLIIEYPK